MASLKQTAGLLTNPIVSGLIGGIVGAAVTIASATFAYWNKDRELDIEMVRISLAILAGENKDTSLQGRRFALRALEKFSTVDIPDDQFEVWAKTGTVPNLSSFWYDAFAGSTRPDATQFVSPARRDLMKRRMDELTKQLNKVDVELRDQASGKVSGNRDDLIKVRETILNQIEETRAMMGAGSEY